MHILLFVLVLNFGAGSELFDEGMRLIAQNKPEQAKSVFNTLVADSSSYIRAMSNYYSAEYATKLSDALAYLDVYFEHSSPSDTVLAKAWRNYFSLHCLARNMEELDQKITNLLESERAFWQFRKLWLQGKYLDASLLLDKLTGIPNQRLDETKTLLKMRIGENTTVSQSTPYLAYLKTLYDNTDNNYANFLEQLRQLIKAYPLTEAAALANRKLNSSFEQAPIQYRLMLGPYSSETKVNNAITKLTSGNFKYELISEKSPEEDDWKRLYFSYSYHFNEAQQIQNYLRAKYKLNAIITKTYIKKETADGTES